MARRSAVKSLGEIALRVNNLPEMRRFYQEVLGFDVLGGFESAVLLKIKVTPGTGSIESSTCRSHRERHGGDQPPHPIYELLHRTSSNAKPAKRCFPSRTWRALRAFLLSELVSERYAPLLKTLKRPRFASNRCVPSRAVVGRLHPSLRLILTV
jgi:catechol 2,3-dioxygenase-like lactoylglutathione lyase family enzyme